MNADYVGIFRNLRSSASNSVECSWDSVFDKGYLVFAVAESGGIFLGERGLDDRSGHGGAVLNPSLPETTNR